MLPRMLAVVPVRGRDGKRRLDASLSADDRARLVEAMLTDVLAACRRAAAVDDVLVVTPDPSIVPVGVRHTRDRGAGHAAALARVLTSAGAEEGVVVVMADCPLVTPEEIDQLAGAASPVALAPAADGGMNAVALRPAGVVEPAFGVPSAAAVTAERARAAGYQPAVLDLPGFAFDVDSPRDLRCLLGSGARSRARRVLDAGMALGDAA
jgi:2-phospho-L-lactate/phosphoenolpyruvate guanylyltransferase